MQTLVPILSTATVNLTGLVSNSGSNAVLNGFQTDFVNELKVGDVVAIPSGAGALEEFTVAASPAPTATALTLSGTPTNAVTSVTATRKRAQLVDQQKNILLRKLQKEWYQDPSTENAGNNSRTSLTFRRSFADTSTAGAISFLLDLMKPLVRLTMKIMFLWLSLQVLVLLQRVISSI